MFLFNMLLWSLILKIFFLLMKKIRLIVIALSNWQSLEGVNAIKFIFSKRKVDWKTPGGYSFIDLGNDIYFILLNPLLLKTMVRFGRRDL